jgi:hypothetical protein
VLSQLAPLAEPRLDHGAADAEVAGLDLVEKIEAAAVS